MFCLLRREDKLSKQKVGINVRLNAQELKHIEDISKATGMTQSSVVRGFIHHSAISVIDPNYLAYFKEVQNEIRRIAINLNQTTKKLHQINLKLDQDSEDQASDVLDVAERHLVLVTVLLNRIGSLSASLKTLLDPNSNRVANREHANGDAGNE